jgi:hypothetical protein
MPASHGTAPVSAPLERATLVAMSLAIGGGLRGSKNPPQEEYRP